MSQYDNATPASRLADNEFLLMSVVEVRSGERFYTVSIDPHETALLHSGIFRSDGMAGNNLCVQFDGEINVRSKSPSTLGIGNADRLVCLRSLEPLGDRYIDLRPRHERAMLA